MTGRRVRLLRQDCPIRRTLGLPPRSPVILASQATSVLTATQPGIFRRSTALPDHALAPWLPSARRRPSPALQLALSSAPTSLASRWSPTLAGAVPQRLPLQASSLPALSPRTGLPPGTPHQPSAQTRPNTSVEARPNGIALGPRGALVHDAPRGPSTTPLVPPHLER
jgi:hypothetical protein